MARIVNLVDEIKTSWRQKQYERYNEKIRQILLDKNPYLASVTIPFISEDPHFSDVTKIVNGKRYMTVGDFLQKYVKNYQPRNEKEEKLIDSVKRHVAGSEKEKDRFWVGNSNLEIFAYHIGSDGKKKYRPIKKSDRETSVFIDTQDYVRKIFEVMTIRGSEYNCLKLEIYREGFF